MSDDGNVGQPAFNLKAVITIVVIIGALGFAIMPGMGRIFTGVYNLAISFYTTLFHDLFPGMDWL